NLHIVGSTSSPNLPGTATGYQPNLAGAVDAYFLRMRPNGSILGATYYGGTGADEARAVAFDASSNSIVVTGITSSTNFHVAQAVQSTLASGPDAFVVKMAANSNQRRWATFYGGTSAEDALDVAVSGNGAICVVGETASGDFPVTQNALQPVLLPYPPQFPP